MTLGTPGWLENQGHSIPNFRLETGEFRAPAAEALRELVDRDAEPTEHERREKPIPFRGSLRPTNSWIT